MNRLAALAGLCALLPLAAHAQKPHARPAVSAPLKSAEAILDANAKAMGAAAAASVKTMTVKGAISLPASNINGTLDISAKNGKFLMRQNLPGVGEVSVGFDGKVGWSRDPVNGMRLLKGPELEQARQQADMSGELQWRKRYSKPELLGIRKVGAANCYAVRMTPKGGTPVTQYYDVKTLTVLRSDVVAESPMGKIPTESYPSDYRSVGGMKMAFKTRTIIAGNQEMVLTFTAVRTNVPVDESIFAPPKEQADAPAKMPGK